MGIVVSAVGTRAFMSICPTHTLSIIQIEACSQGEGTSEKRLRNLKKMMIMCEDACGSDQSTHGDKGMRMDACMVSSSSP